MVDKSILKQYSDLKQEICEVKGKIANLEKQIERIEAEGCVTDTVTGGEGGIQHFTISGFPNAQYSRKKTLLYTRKSTLELLEMDILEKIVQVEEFINSIDDSYMRRIINYRFIDNLSWVQVSFKMGAGYTEDSVRMAFERFMQKK